MREKSPCPLECRMCSGEYCSIHFAGPCGCDVIDRHGIKFPAMSEQNQKRPNCGEPWTITPFKPGYLCAIHSTKGPADGDNRLKERAVVCVNACAGLEDPAAFIGLHNHALDLLRRAIEENERLRSENARLRELARPDFKGGVNRWHHRVDGTLPEVEAEQEKGGDV